MFEANTYDNLLASVLAAAPAEIDKRQGSVFYDAVSGILLQIARLYADLDGVFNCIFLDTATGEYLDRKAAEYGITRYTATNATYNYIFDGTVPADGTRYFESESGLYFVLKTLNNTKTLESTATGESANNITSGAPALPVNAIYGLTLSQFGNLLTAGLETETDGNLRNRIIQKIKVTNNAGTKAWYKATCEAFQGVGRARIIPLFDALNPPNESPNFVTCVILDMDGNEPTQTLIDGLQEYIDPDCEGLGVGAAPLGAHVRITAAQNKTVDIALNSVILNSGFNLEQARTIVINAVQGYIKTINLAQTEAAATLNYTLFINAVTAVIFNTGAFLNFALLLNGESSDVIISSLQCAEIGGVVLDE